MGHAECHTASQGQLQDQKHIFRLQVSMLLLLPSLLRFLDVPTIVAATTGGYGGGVFITTTAHPTYRKILVPDCKQNLLISLHGCSFCLFTLKRSIPAPQAQITDPTSNSHPKCSYQAFQGFEEYGLQSCFHYLETNSNSKPYFAQEVTSES